jgi:hypothetical protein
MNELSWDEYSCEVCGYYSDDCVCPECPLCGEIGDPYCYQEVDLGICGGLYDVGLNIDQKISKARARITENQEQLYDAGQALDILEAEKLVLAEWFSIFIKIFGGIGMPDHRHGGPYDRGATDSYYRRGISPHYFKGATYQSEKVTDLTLEEVAEYMRGYNDNENDRNFKEWELWNASAAALSCASLTWRIAVKIVETIIAPSAPTMKWVSGAIC